MIFCYFVYLPDVFLRASRQPLFKGLIHRSKVFKIFNRHNCKKVDNRDHSLDQLQTMCLRVGRLLLRNTLGFRRIRQIHTFKLTPIQMHEMIKDRQLFLRHHQQ